MRKILLSAGAAICTLAMASCNETDKGMRFEGDLSGDYRINAVSAGEDLYKTFELTFDENGRMTKGELIEGEWSEIWVLDYSTPGRIKIADSDRYFVLNDKNLISEFVKDEYESLKFDYDADGYMVKVTEYWEGEAYPKSTLTVSDGNITSYSKWTKIEDAGDTEEKEHFRKFTYGTRENTHGIYQAYSEALKDYEWLLYSGYFGKPSKNLAEGFVWDYNEGKEDGSISYNYSFYGDGVTLRLFKTSDDDNTKARTYGYQRLDGSDEEQ